MSDQLVGYTVCFVRVWASCKAGTVLEEDFKYSPSNCSSLRSITASDYTVLLINAEVY